MILPSSLEYSFECSVVCGRAFSLKPFFLNRVLSTTESLTQLSAYPGNPGKAPAWQRGDETPKRWLNCNLSSHHLLPGLRAHGAQHKSENVASAPGSGKSPQGAQVELGARDFRRCQSGEGAEPGL